MTLPTNASVSIERLSSTIASDLPVLILPARPEIVATREVPATKAFECFFKALVDVKEQDFIVEGTARYKVVGVAHYRTPKAPHTEVVAEQIWGTA